MPSIVDRKTAEEMKPFFTSVVNSMDVVPRLSNGTLAKLSEEIRACAEESGAALDEDVQHYVERLTSIWAPRFRDGTPMRDVAFLGQDPRHAQSQAGQDPSEAFAVHNSDSASHATEDLYLIWFHSSLNFVSSCCVLVNDLPDGCFLQSRDI